MIREQVVQFGKGNGLTGVITLPEGTVPRDRPAFIFLNSGILHRVGSCRLHVRLARMLAEAGFPALRFDFSGIGDSEPRKDSLAFDVSAPLEVREAMDYLATKRGISRFVLGGLCSGADMAHLTARDDERVVGLVMLDAWAYRTSMFWVHHYLVRALQLSVWKRWASVRLGRILGSGAARVTPKASDGSVEYEVPKYVRPFPPREVIAGDLRTFVGRGVRLLTVFTSGQSDLYNHPGQYRSSFGDVPFGELLEEHFLRDADHIITGLGDQTRVIQCVETWSRQHFAPLPVAAVVAASAVARANPLGVAEAR